MWVKCGICSGESVLNIFLCMVGFLPGLLHAWYIIAKHPEPVIYYGADDSEDGRVRYVVVDQDDNEDEAGARRQQQQRPQSRPKPKSQPARHAGMSYGTGDETAGSSSPPPTAAPPQPYDYNAGEGSSGDLPPPPSYAQVMGDHKIQDRG